MIGSKEGEIGHVRAQPWNSTPEMVPKSLEVHLRQDVIINGAQMEKIMQETWISMRKAMYGAEISPATRLAI